MGTTSLHVLLNTSSHQNRRLIQIVTTYLMLMASLHRDSPTVATAPICQASQLKTTPCETNLVLQEESFLGAEGD